MRKIKKLVEMELYLMNIEHILEQPLFKTNVLNNSQCCQNMITLFSLNGLIRNIEHRNIDFSKIW